MGSIFKEYKTHKGDLVILEDNKNDFDDIDTLEGNLIIFGGVKFEPKNLERILGHVKLKKKAKFYPSRFHFNIQGNISLEKKS